MLDAATRAAEDVLDAATRAAEDVLVTATRAAATHQRRVSFRRQGVGIP
ncbi:MULTISPECIES: hypothetical protein [unclassified Microbispora]|nr:MULTISPECIES: hypothetical protein [unclassified Microbispora]NJP25213.1 hypothetical protein [Microbispora sp. CL1-1]